jgi:hypothetical protein
LLLKVAAVSTVGALAGCGGEITGEHFHGTPVVAVDAQGDDAGPCSAASPCGLAPGSPDAYIATGTWVPGADAAGPTNPCDPDSGIVGDVACAPDASDAGPPVWGVAPMPADGSIDDGAHDPDAAFGGLMPMPPDSGASG